MRSITRTLRIWLFHLSERLQGPWADLVWALFVIFPTLVLRAVTLGYVAIKAPKLLTVLVRIQSLLTGVRNATKKELDSLEKVYRERATAICATVGARLSEREASFNTRVGELQRRIVQGATEIATAKRSLSVESEDLDRDETVALDELVRRYAEDALEITMEWFPRRRKIVLHAEQVMGALALLDGYFAQLKNGEGKTFTVAAATAALGMLIEGWRSATRVSDPPRRSRKNVVVLTANEYLVRRDIAWVRPLYHELGVSSAYALESMTQSEKRQVYRAAVIYATGSGFGFDLIFDTLRQVDEPSFALAPFRAILDEADQLLLDEARTPHVVQGSMSASFRSAIPESWVHMVAHWAERYFVPNCVYREDAGRLDVLPAGQLLVYARRLAGSASWSTPDGPWARAVLFELVVAAECARHSGRPPEGWPAGGMRQILEDRDSLVTTRTGEVYASRELKDLLSSGSTFRGRLQMLRALTDLAFRLRKLSRFLIPHMTEEEVTEWNCCREQILGRGPLQLLRRSLGLRKLSRALANILPRLAVETDSAEARAFWEGVWYLTTLVARGPQQPDRPASSMDAWVMQTCVPYALNALQALHRIAGDPAGDPMERDAAGSLSATLDMLLVAQRTLNRLPTAHVLLERVGILGGDRLLLMIAANRLLDDDGRPTTLGSMVANALVGFVAGEVCIGAGRPPATIRGFVETALHVYFGLKRDRDYVVDDRRLVLVDQVTGRREEKKHFGSNRHPFALLKEGLPYEHPRPIEREMAVASFLRYCDRVVGTSATLVTAEEELRWLYRPRTERQRPAVVRIREHVRRLLDRLEPRLAITTRDKLQSIVQEVFDARNSGRPVLVVADSVAESKQVHSALVRAAVERELDIHIPLLNADHPEYEEEVVCHAGEARQITVATHMAGRGTDITLDAEALSSGGLLVLLSSLPESRRVQEQAEGRAARQGEPGSTRTYITFDDEVMVHSMPAGRRVWVQNRIASFSSGGDDAIIQGPFITDVLSTTHDEINAKFLQMRRNAYTKDDTVALVRDQILGWREGLVLPNSKSWRKVLLDVMGRAFDVFLRGDRVGMGAMSWQEVVRSAIRVIDARESGSSTAIDKLVHIFGVGLSRHDARRILRALAVAERAAAASPPSDTDEKGEVLRFQATSTALWEALARIDRARFERARGDCYANSPRGADPEMPVLETYLDLVDNSLIRGLDERVFLAHYVTCRSTVEEQIRGPRAILEAAVRKAIADAKPPSEGRQERFERIVLPAWARDQNGRPAPEVGAAHVVQWIEDLAPGLRHRARAELVHVIDRCWCEAIDEMLLLDSDVRETPTVMAGLGDGSNQAVKLVDLLIDCRDECTLEFVEKCDRLIGEGWTLPSFSPRQPTSGELEGALASCRAAEDGAEEAGREY